MGYEVNMFLGDRRRSSFHEEGGKDWFEVIATVDLSKPFDALGSLAHMEDGDPVYMYASDGNRRLVEDSYGKKLIAIPAERVLTLLKQDAANGYRRYDLAIAILEVFVAGKFKNPSVVLYGH